MSELLEFLVPILGLALFTGGAYAVRNARPSRRRLDADGGSTPAGASTVEDASPFDENDAAVDGRERLWFAVGAIGLLLGCVCVFGGLVLVL